MKEDKPFKQVTLPEKNYVLLSNSLPNYYDTIVKIALDKVHVHNQTVFVNPINEENSENGVLAHVKRFEGKYYLFISQLDKKQAIEVISHEAYHILQYESEFLDYNYSTGMIYWEGDEYYVDAIPYENRPWERDAFSYGVIISNMTEKELW